MKNRPGKMQVKEHYSKALIAITLIIASGTNVYLSIIYLPGTMGSLVMWSIVTLIAIFFLIVFSMEKK